MWLFHVCKWRINCPSSQGGASCELSFYSHEDQHVDTAEAWAKIDLHVASNQRWIGSQISQFVSSHHKNITANQKWLCCACYLSNFSWFSVTHLIPFEFWGGDIDHIWLTLWKAASEDVLIYTTVGRVNASLVLLLVAFTPIRKQEIKNKIDEHDVQ